VSLGQGVATARSPPDDTLARDDKGQLRTGHGTRRPLPVRADGAGANLGLAI
jgi:hypothetical protein